MRALRCSRNMQVFEPAGVKMPKYAAGSYRRYGVFGVFG